MFVDSAKVLIRAGDGGRGCVSFRRERFKPRGGPDGGDGGHGGDVIFIGSSNINSLSRFRYTPRLFAKNGQPGRGNNCSGKKGKSITVKVPCGTIIKNFKDGTILHEIIEPDIPIIVAKGGKGGMGNQHFATPTKQAPRYAQKGLPGEAFEVELELKIIADVGLVGLPNAGKSSLISKLSNAHPKIAEYPFTTLNPVVGVVELPEFRSIVMADIPGIIQGASSGKGLGLKFLKHIERTKAILYVIDISSFADSPAEKAFSTLSHELSTFGHGLTDKKFLIAANKTDIDPDGISLNDFLNKIGIEAAQKVPVTGQA